MRPKINLATLYFLLTLLLSACIFAEETAEPEPAFGAMVQFTGVNLAGAEFTPDALPGQFGVDYTYPTADEINYFYTQGMNTFRIPFRWERLQPVLFENFDEAELGRLKQVVDHATALGGFVILDPHNSVRYHGNVIGDSEVPVEAFADFWRRLAAEFQTNSRVIFGLINEPHDIPTERWTAIANTTIAAIRSQGANNLILVPGNGFSNAHSWSDSWYGTPNATEMLKIQDPINNFAFEVHQYLDENSTGTSEVCISETIGSERLEGFTQWLIENNRRGFLGEFAGGRNERCYTALHDMLQHINRNSNVWLGWTYWAAGPWWGDYLFSIEPDGQPRPQMRILKRYLFARPSIYIPFAGSGQ